MKVIDKLFYLSEDECFSYGMETIKPKPEVSSRLVVNNINGKGITFCLTNCKHMAHHRGFWRDYPLLFFVFTDKNEIMLGSVIKDEYSWTKENFMQNCKVITHIK